MIYALIKAAHLAAMVAWIGGLLSTAVLCAGMRSLVRPLPSQTIALLTKLRGWDRRVTGPAMLLTWGLGLTLAQLGDWFPARWLLLKLSLVAGLSALHGLQVGALRRLASGGPDSVLARWAVPGAILATVAAVAALVVVKPN